MAVKYGENSGFLCPPEYASELEKNLIEKSPVRKFCRVRTTGSKLYQQPIRVGIPRASRPGEAAESDSYVMEELLFNMHME